MMVFNFTKIDINMSFTVFLWKLVSGLAAF